ncbi:MAG TPA: transcriptional repressor LexA [Actinomycetota bacterium]|nr:transcriptional repressor LexA [Actinomycetota bacterium]
MDTNLDGSDLTPKQRAILDFIVQAVEARGFPPAVREICEAVGLSSPSTVHAHLGTLEDRGYIRRDPTKPRAIEVRWRQSVDEAPVLAEDRTMRELPIYGSIAAGPTSLAEQNLEGILPFPKEFLSDTSHFVLSVKGESMIDAGILDGDLVVIRSQQDASNGDIVAAQVNGETGEAEATIKRLRKEAGRVVLVPANPTMEPIPAPPDVRILGKAVALLRLL